MLLSQLCDKKDPVCFTQALPINAKCDLKVHLYTYKVVHMFALCSFCWAVSPSSVSLALPHSPWLVAVVNGGRYFFSWPL